MTTLQEQVWLQAIKQCEARVSHWLQAIKQCEARVSQTEREHSVATAQLRIAVEELRRARASRVAVPTLTDAPPINGGPL